MPTKKNYLETQGSEREVFAFSAGSICPSDLDFWSTMYMNNFYTYICNEIEFADFAVLSVATPIDRLS